MEHLTRKIEVETQMRELLQANDLPQPDRVEYGVACVRFFFEAARRVVVIDLDSVPEQAPGPSGAG
jgi:hypothetical protein